MNRDVLVNKILSDSGIVGHNLRADTAREIRSHIDDIIEDELAAGHTEDEIERLVALRFGRPSEIAKEFATVYRTQRIILSIISYSLLILASILTAAAFVYSIQYGAVRLLGESTAIIFSKSHITIESVLLSGLTLGYLALYFLERLFKRNSFVKTLSLVGAVVLGLVVCLEVSGLGIASELFAGFLFAVFVRSLERLLFRSLFKLFALLSFFSLISILESYLVTCLGKSPSWLLLLPLYLAIAVSSQFTGYFAHLFDRQILKRHFA